YLGAAADPTFVEHVARGESIQLAPSTPLHRVPAGKTLAGWIATKALAEGTDTSGGVLVPPELAAEVLMPLRARSAVMSLGVTVVPVRKELDVAALSTGASASYTTENARIAVSEETFAISVVLRPKPL